MNVSNDRASLNRWLDEVTSKWTSSQMNEEMLQKELTSLEQAVNDLQNKIPEPDNYDEEKMRLATLKRQISKIDSDDTTIVLETFLENLAKVLGSIFR